MQTQVALGFAWLLLNENQRMEIKRAWSQYPRGRHLMPFDMGRILKIDLTQKVSDLRQDLMQGVWIDFCRSADIDQSSIPWSQDEWFAWMDYASKHFREPVTVESGRDWIQ